MRVVLIKPKEEAKVVELADNHKYTDIKDLLEISSPLTCVERKIGGQYYDIWCDDEGLLKDKKYLCGVATGNFEALCGNLLITHHDEEGNTTGLSEEEIESIMSHIFLNKDFLEHAGYLMKNDEAIVFNYGTFGNITMNQNGMFLIYEI